jgi:hypothetical protein
VIDAWYYLHKSIARSIKNSFITVFLGVTQFIACFAIDKLYQHFPADNLVLNKPCYFFFVGMLVTFLMNLRIIALDIYNQIYSLLCSNGRK